MNEERLEEVARIMREAVLDKYIGCKLTKPTRDEADPRT